MNNSKDRSGRILDGINDDDDDDDYGDDHDGDSLSL